MNQELIDLIALGKIPKIGPVMSKHLIAYAGSISNVFSLTKKDLLSIPSIGIKIADSILKSNLHKSAEKELNLCAKHGIKTVHFWQDQYPHRLKHFEDAPLVLYYKGSLDNINSQRTIGIVGSRKPTINGSNLLTQILNELTTYSVTTISGLAYGIDSLAHRESLNLKIPTYGIMGNGFKNIYPSSNYALSKKMENNGGVLTEFSFNAIPDRANFPMRNRIIAALSDAIIVVESKQKGGSMITADFANQYNKDVFAIPGRINDDNSKGTNFLIKTHRANLLTCAKDIGYLMGWDHSIQKPKQTNLFIDLTEEEQALIDCFKISKELSMDQLAFQTSNTISKIATITLNLEFKGIIRSIPGKRFTLI